MSRTFRSGKDHFKREKISNLKRLRLINDDELEDDVDSCNLTIKLNASHIIAQKVVEFERTKHDSSSRYNRIYETMMSMQSDDLYKLVALMEK